MILDVCICTYSPDPKIIEKTIRALVSQDLGPKGFQVLIVDNASKPALSLKKHPYSLLVEAGINTRIVYEDKLGVAHARIRAIKETQGECIVFVDDDNILDKQFLSQALQILKDNPTVGCFSGKISFPEEIQAPLWTRPIQYALAVRECGEEQIVEFFKGEWKQWVPTATASMVVRRNVLNEFMVRHGSNPQFFNFGRKGHKNLTSGEDFLIALSAESAGMKCGYFPQLKMQHWIRRKRFSFWYIAKLMRTYGKTDLMRTDYLSLAIEPFDPVSLKYRLMVLGLKGQSIRARMCLFMYEIVYVVGIAKRLLLQGRWPIKKPIKEIAAG